MEAEEELVMLTPTTFGLMVVVWVVLAAAGELLTRVTRRLVLFGLLVMAALEEEVAAWLLAMASKKMQGEVTAAWPFIGNRVSQ